jgi:hypothetical protein
MRGLDQPAMLDAEYHSSSFLVPFPDTVLLLVVLKEAEVVTRQAPCPFTSIGGTVEPRITTRTESEMHTFGELAAYRHNSSVQFRRCVLRDSRQTVPVSR